MASVRATRVDGSPSAAQFVHEHLRDAILRGELRPNMRLVEEELAASLEVSRTPVREALLALAQDGLVVRARGWSVRDHGPEEILRILEARAAVEGAAAGLAAQRIDDAGLARLKGLATEMERADQSRQILNQLNREFHAVITEAAGNALLVQFSKRTHISHWNFSIPMISPISPPGDDEVVNAEHRAIIEHLEAREADRAAQTVRTHIERSRAIVAAALEITEPPH